MKTGHKIYLTFFSALILSITSLGQNTFRISYDVDPLYDMPGGIIEATTGNYVFGGGLLVGGITEVDQTGTVTWSELFSEGTTIFSDIINVGTGYLVAGSSSNQLLLAETSSTGVITWGKKYNTSASSETASQVKRLANGDYIIAGSVSGYDIDGPGGVAVYDSSNLYIVKTNSVGTVLWDKIMLPSLASRNEHYLYDVAEVTGGYIFVGSTDESANNGATSDALILKTDANGNLLWTKKMGAAGVDDSFQSINILSSGQVLISGFIDEDALMLRVDANGNNTFSYTYNDPDLFKVDVTQGFNAFETSDGKYACVGTYIDVITFMNGVNGNFPMFGTFLIKIEPSNGNIIFQKFYQNGLSALMPDAIQTTDNGYLLTMMAQEIAPLSGFNYHVVKTDVNGDAGTNCDIATIGLVNSGYTPSFVAVTPNAYSGTTASNFTPLLNTPTPGVGAICCTVDNPTTASASPSTVCAGQSVTVSASGSAPGVTYDIYTASTGGTLVGTAGTPFVPTQGAYYVEAVSPLGCKSVSRIIVNITITVAPTATVSGGGSYCVGGTTPNVNIAFTQAGPWNVTYSNGTSSFSITTSSNPYVISNGIDGTYTVTAISNASCAGTFSGSATITTNALPTISVAGTTTICSGSGTSLTASGASTYVWSPATGLSATTGAVVTASPTVGTTYTVSGTDANTCVNSTTVSITVNTLPNVVASVSPTANVCAGDQITLTGSGATSYAWDNGVTNGVAFTPITTTYTVTGTDGNGCQNTDQMIVTVNSLPLVVANSFPATSVCTGDQITLTGSGATSYTWDNGVTNGVAFTPITTTYTVTGTDGNGCSNTGQVSIVVNPLPTVVANVSPSATICTGSSVTLTGSGATSYTWDNGVTDNVSFVPASTTLYTVTGTDGNGCINTDAITVNIVAPPVAAINGGANGTTTACSNATTTLTATPAGGTYLWTPGNFTTQSIDVMPTANTTYNVTVTIGSCSDATGYTVNVNTAPTGALSGTGNNLVCTGTNDTLTAVGGVTYLWNTSQTTPSIVVTPVAPTDYTVVVYDAVGCTDTLIYSVAVNALPSIFITSLNDTICTGSTTTLSGNGGVSYVWGTTETTSTIDVTPAVGTTTFTVEGTDGNGCINTAAYDIYVSQLPSVVIAGDTSVCLGGSIILTAVSAVPGGTYNWIHSGESTASVSVSPVLPTTYTVEDQIGTCVSSAQVTIDITPSPNIVIGADTSIIIGQEFTLNAINTANSTATTEYSWITPNDNLSCLNCSNPTASPDETIQYCVVGEQNGCLDTTCINVEVRIDCGEVFVPNAFSPNGDENNDCLKVYSNCLVSITFKVYDRWGEVVFETTDIEGCWDGTYKGELLNTATFAYVLEYELIDGNSAIVKGNVSLLK